MKNLILDPKTGCQVIRKTIPAAVRGHVVWPRSLADHVGLTTFKLSLGRITEPEARRRAAPIISALGEAIADAKARRRGIEPPTADDALAPAETGSSAATSRDELGTPQPRPVLPIPGDPKLCAKARSEAGIDAPGPAGADTILRLIPAILREANITVPPQATYAQPIPGEMRITAGELSLTVSSRQQALKSQAPTITAVMEDFLALERPKEERQIRYYVRRLVEHIGDKPVDEVTKLDMTGMLVSLRQFPVMKSGRAKDAMTFGEILEQFEEDEGQDGEPIPRIVGKTIRTKWFAAYRQIFSFAVDHDLLGRSPIIMPKKAHDGSRIRRAFEADEIVTLFSRPLFTGNDGAAQGYFLRPGTIVTRDARFWLPILALTTGMRLSEMADALTEDIRLVDNVHVLDLTYRTLKTRQSRRFVPLSRLLFEDIGFREYVEQRRNAGASRLFDIKSAQWGKWWGLWMTENGFEDPDLSFHSFRHTFKRFANDSGQTAAAEIIMGHSGGNAVADAYGGRGLIPRRFDGKPMSLRARLEALDKIEFPALAFL